MPSFEYTAIDRQGKTVQGSLQANTRDEAALSLTRTGLLVSRLEQSGGATAAVAQPQARPRTQPITQSAPVQRPLQRQEYAPQPLRVNTPTARYPRGDIRTKAGTDRENYFIFSQLYSFAKAGINPAEAYDRIANGLHRDDYKKSLREAGVAATEGGRMSDIFEKYIDLYPPHVAGILRCGEQAGYLPEAYNAIAEQAQTSHKYRRLFRQLLWFSVINFGILPLGWVVTRGALRSWDVQEATGGQSPGMGTLVASIGKELLWPVGPLIVVVGLGSWLFARFWQSMARRPLRHRLVLTFGIINRRTRAESLAIFSWCLSLLSRSGLPPKSAFGYAAQAVPNLEIRRQLEEASAHMSDQTRLSEVLGGARVFPMEVGAAVQTGEITGDVPGALMSAAQMSQDDFKAADQGAKVRVGCWFFLVLALGAVLMVALYTTGFMSPLIEKVTGGEVP